MVESPATTEADNAVALIEAENLRFEQLLIQRRVLEQAEENRAVAMALQANSTMTEAWGDLVDPLEYLSDEPTYSPNYGRTSPRAISRPDDRLDGRNRPVFENEWELMAIIGAARLIYEAFPTAQTALENLTNFVLGEGFTTKTSAQPGCPDGLAAAVLAVLDEFHALNHWQSDNGKEEECFRRLHRDGEAICVLHPVDGGRARLKFIEPSQLTQPDRTRELEDWLSVYEASTWTFGVHAREGDPETVFGYYCQWSPKPGDFDYYPANRVVHIKANVDSGIKRGLSDFYSVQSHLTNIGKLERNVALGAAILSAIIGIRQHAEGTTRSQAQDLINSLRYRSRSVSTPAGARTMNTFKAEPGTLLDIPRGMEYKQSPLANQGVGQAFVTVEQALMRTVGTRWCMPEYMISGDASNANYSSTMVAESPFVKLCKRKQRNHRANVLEIDWAALRIACEAGRFRQWDVREVEDLQRLVTIVLQPPIVEARDRPAETNRRKILHDDGVISAQTWAEEEGYDHVEEQKRGAARKSITLPGLDTLNGPSIPQTQGQAPSPTSVGPSVDPNADAGIEVASSTTLNGAQITAASDLFAKVASGAMAPDVALELLISIGLERQTATKMLAAQAEVDSEKAVRGLTANPRESRHARLSAAAALLWEGYP